MAGSGGRQGSFVQASDGKIYGTSYHGGNFGRGSVYVLAPDSQGGWNFSILHSFNGADGEAPLVGLIQAKDGKFYGTTNVGGAANLGTVFRTDSSGSLTT